MDLWHASRTGIHCSSAKIAISAISWAACVSPVALKRVTTGSWSISIRTWGGTTQSSLRAPWFHPQDPLSCGTSPGVSSLGSISELTTVSACSAGRSIAKKQSCLQIEAVNTESECCKSRIPAAFFLPQILPHQSPYLQPEHLRYWVHCYSCAKSRNVVISFLIVPESLLTGFAGTALEFQQRTPSFQTVRIFI